MEKKEVEISSPKTIGGVTLIPVVEFSLTSWCNRGHFSCFGIKQPTSVAVVSPSWKRTFKISGEEVPLDQLIKEIPGIKEAMDTI